MEINYNCPDHIFDQSLQAIDRLYGFGQMKFNFGKDLTGEEELRLRDGLLSVFIGFRDCFKAPALIPSNHHDLQNGLDVLQNAIEEVSGIRAASASLLKVVDAVSKFARDRDMYLHMTELGMPLDSVGEFFYHLQFDDSDRRNGQLAYIDEVHKYVKDHAGKWAEDVYSQRSKK